MADVTKNPKLDPHPGSNTEKGYGQDDHDGDKLASVHWGLPLAGVSTGPTVASMGPWS